ncbi:MAG: HBL/NHE enterotoxin family protein [Endozoicomonas sp. (ex Botrylloides leachii)]|nr:HBL/NHE enterotoxin family protein [Endozoicomonas sp. (ex Botrylloides leachii)]
MSDNTQLNSTQQSTQSAFLAVHVITAQCHAILNTQFIPPDVKPDWFDDLNAKLDTAKSVAKDWVDNLAPEVSASIPAQVIDYGATFDASVTAIHELYDQDPTASGSDNPSIVEVKAVMQNLSTEVGKKQAVVTTMQGKLKTWGIQMQSAHDDLVTGASNIQKTIVDLQTDIENMDNAIANNRAAIAKLNKDLVYAQVAIGVGVFMLVAGVALTVATAGTAAVVSGGIAALGAASIIGGGVTWGVIQGQIDDDYSKIAQEQKQKTEDQQQIVALQGLSNASSAVVSAIELSTSTLSDFETTWKLFDDELQGVIDKLDSGADMSSIIMEKVMTDAAKNEWDDAVELAKQLSDATVTVESKAITPIAA